MGEFEVTGKLSANAKKVSANAKSSLAATLAFLS
jgi:hypothetical protein